MLLVMWVVIAPDAHLDSTLFSFKYTSDVVKTWVNEKSAQRRHKHYMLAVVRPSQKSFAPPQTLFPGCGTGKINQLEMVTTFT